ncbi:hypothetical protein HZ99_03160 [Pseudomonas fluorescens]|nr:hypothetical protein HZ99_03160 [Pseudomonas fluorescens]
MTAKMFSSYRSVFGGNPKRFTPYFKFWAGELCGIVHMKDFRLSIVGVVFWIQANTCRKVYFRKDRMTKSASH